MSDKNPFFLLFSLFILFYFIFFLIKDRMAIHGGIAGRREKPPGQTCLQAHSLPRLRVE